MKTFKQSNKTSCYKLSSSRTIKETFKTHFTLMITQEQFKEIFLKIYNKSMKTFKLSNKTSCY